jgi:hypothetical protein
MTMRTSYIVTALKNAYILATGGRHVVHSMDAACEFQLYRKEICTGVRSCGMDTSSRGFEFLDFRLRKYETVWSTKVQG